MVLSSINSNIHYRESRYVEKEDIDLETQVYKGKLLGCLFEFVLGHVKYTYKVDNILYIPVYIIKYNEQKQTDFFCIGVYEFKYDELNYVSDEQGNINVENLKNFRMFKYVKRENLICYKNDFETDIESDDEEDEGDEYDDDENKGEGENENDEEDDGEDDI